MTTQPLGVLDRPSSLRPSPSPGEHPPVVRHRRIDPDGVDLPGRARLNRGGRVSGFVRIDPDQHHRQSGSLLLLRGVGSAADNPTSRSWGCLAVTPLLSQAANGHRTDDTPKASQPGTGSRKYSSQPSDVLRHARAANPDATPLSVIQVGSTDAVARSTLLCLSSDLAEVRLVRFSVESHGGFDAAEEPASECAFQRTSDIAVSFALRSAFGLVFLGLGIAPEFGDRDSVQSPVEVAVTTTVEPVPGALAAAGFQRRDSGERCEGCFVADPAGV